MSPLDEQLAKKTIGRIEKDSLKKIKDLMLILGIEIDDNEAKIYRSLLKEKVEKEFPKMTTMLDKSLMLTKYISSVMPKLPVNQQDNTEQSLDIKKFIEEESNKKNKKLSIFDRYVNKITNTPGNKIDEMPPLETVPILSPTLPTQKLATIQPEPKRDKLWMFRPATIPEPKRDLGGLWNDDDDDDFDMFRPPADDGWFEVEREPITDKNRHLINITKPIGIAEIGRSIKSFDDTKLRMASNGTLYDTATLDRLHKQIERIQKLHDKMHDRKK